MDSQLDVLAKQSLFEAVAALKQAESLLGRADSGGPYTAVSLTSSALEILRSLPAENSSVIALTAWAFLLRGHALREQATTPSRTAAVAAYDEALRLWDTLPAQEAPHFRNHQAKAWMNRGITLLNEGGTGNLTEAIRCFDCAIKIRQEIGTEQEPWIRFGLAAGWMNRGDALTRLGGEKNLNTAVASYDEALQVMDSLPIDADSLFRQRVAIACLNRGITLETLGTEASLCQALASFDQAIAVLENTTAAPKRPQVVATAWMNRGNVLLKSNPVDALAAREAAQRSLDCVAQLEREDVSSAEIGLKARHLWCRAVAVLTEQPTEAANKADYLAESTDVVEEGMEIVRHWQAKGTGQFADLASDFFRFGARVYRTYQPHFFDEFLRENYDLDMPPKR